MNKKFQKLKILLIFFIAFSCGIRVDDEDFDNIFPGTWEVSQIRCFNAGIAVENYTTTSTGRVIRFVFDNKDFTYTVVEPGTGGCSLNMTGLYSTTYTNSTNGIASMFSIQNSNQCEITLNDTGAGTGDQTVSFALLEVEANSLEFNFSSNRLELEFPTTFDGSAVSNLCSNVCQCFFVATKTD